MRNEKFCGGKSYYCYFLFLRGGAVVGCELKAGNSDLDAGNGDLLQEADAAKAS